MKRLMSFLAVTLLMVSFANGQGPAGTIPVSASNVVDSTGTKLTSGTVYFAPVDTRNNPTSYRMGTSGQALSRAVSAVVTNGSFSINLPDTAHTSPLNVCFAGSLIDNATGEDVWSGAYGCVQPSSSASWCSTGTCLFDTYVPNLAAMGIVYPATVSLGSVTTGLPGTSAVVTMGGTPSAGVVNFTLPQGIQGPIGAPTSGVNLTPTVTQNVVGPFGASLNSTELQGVYNASMVPSGTDIGAKINALITACASAVCPIFIPAGIYNFPTPIALTSNVTLYGAGQTSTILNYTGSTTIAVASNGNNNYLHDFTLNGTSENVVTSSYNTLLGIYVYGNHTTLDKLSVNHFWGLGAAVTVSGANDTVSNSDLEDSRIPLQALTNGTVATGTIFRNNYLNNHMTLAVPYENPNIHHWDCMEIEASTDTLVEGNTAEDCGQSGIYYGANGDSTMHVRIIGNKIIHAWNRGIDGGVTGDVTGTNNIYGLVVANNVVQDSLADNIWSVCASNGSITGNYAEYTTGYAAYFGSFATTTRSGLAVSDICGSTTADVANYITVTGNTSYDYTGTAFSGLSLNIKATSVGNSWANNITNVGFFQASTISFATNYITNKGTINPLVTNQVHFRNTATPLFVEYDPTHALTFTVDASGNSYFGGTSGTYNFLCSGGGTTCLGVTSTAITSSLPVVSPSFRVGNGAGPTWTTGSTDPSGACVNGSIYSNGVGATGHAFWACASSAWVDVK